MAVPESGKGSKNDQQKDKGKQQKPNKGQKGAQDDKEAELSEEVGAVIDCCSSGGAQAGGCV